MPYSTTRLFLIVLAFTFFMKSLEMPIFDVVKLGAKPDGKTDSKMAFQKAWDSACGSSEPASIYVPNGTFLLYDVHFEGPCKNEAVFFNISGSIVAPDYTQMGKVLNWIEFNGINGVSIESGIFDGKGSSLWECKASSKNCSNGVTALAFYNSKNINITGLTSKDSELYHMVFSDCQHIKLLNVTVSAPRNSPNTDGIHLQKSNDVSILNSTIGTGDDCVSIGAGTTNVWIEDVFCGPGHGISIGSLGKSLNEEGVSNITVTTATFKDTQNGVRIKTWARPFKSSVTNILFQHAIMKNVQNPIIIDQHYCPGIPHCPHQASGVNITDVRYKDINGTSATKLAIKFDCSETNPCKKLILKGINLTYKSQPAKAWCSNASGLSSGAIEPPCCLTKEI